MKSLPWLRIVCSFLAGGLALFILWHVPYSWPRAVIPNCLDSEFEFTPDSRNLVVWSGRMVFLGSTLHMNEPGIHVHDVATGARRCTFTDSEKHMFLLHVSFSADSRLAVASDGQELSVWETATGRRAVATDAAMRTGDHGPGFTFPPDGEVIFVCRILNNDAMVARRGDDRIIIDTDPGVSPQFLDAGKGPLSVLVTHGDVLVIDRTTGKMVHAFPLPGGKRFENFKLWANGKILTAYEGVSTRTWYIWPAPGREPIRLEHVEYPNAFHISADGKWLAGAQAVPQSPWLGRMIEKLLRRPPPNSALHIIRLEDGSEMGSIRNGVDARISPDGRTLAVSCNNDGRLELWDFPLRKPTLLIGLLSGLTALIVFQGLRWWQKRRLKLQPAIGMPK